MGSDTSYDNEPRLFPAAPGQAPYITGDREWILKEVRQGLRSHRGRLAAAIENQAFYDLDSERYAQRREAETEFDFAGRPRRVSGFTQQVVDRLCEHTYNPGPSRTVVDDEQAEELLEQIWDDTSIDCVLNHAETYSTINDVCAIQVVCTGDLEKPVDLFLWGADEFTVFTDPDDPRMAVAVVTIDRYDQRTRYRVWFDDEVWTFLTDQYSLEKTAGAKTAEQWGEVEENTYGCIPFAFMHYRMPVRYFWTPGPGTFLRKTELRINDRLSELDELIMKYGRPIGVFKNVSPTFTPEVGPGRFMRLCRGGTGFTGEGYADGGEPTAEYLQAQLAIEGIWLDLEKYTRQIATVVGLPYESLELDYGTAPSGISLLVKKAPLISRQRQRRPIYQAVEKRLASTILACYAAHYGKLQFLRSARELNLLLAWPEPKIMIPGPDRDAADEWELTVGIKSRVMICAERYGLTRDQAIDHLKQVAEDEQAIKEILPQELTPPASETMPSEEQDARRQQQDEVRGGFGNVDAMEANKADTENETERMTSEP